MRGGWMVVLGVAWSGTAQAAVGGVYQGPLGGLEIQVSGGKVTGKALGGGPCGFKKGQPVLDGQMLDDSVAGKLAVCAKGEGCGMEQAFAVLLVARKGALLSGAVQVKGKQCTLPGGGKGMQLTRVAAKGADKAARGGKDKGARDKAGKDKAGAEKNAPDKNANGKPGEATGGGTESGADAAQPVAGRTDAAAGGSDDAATPFEDWSPVPADGKPVEGDRPGALQKAREAEALLNRGQFEAARPLLLEALKRDPGYAEGYNMVGVTFYARDRNDDALDWYKKALTVNPDFGDAYYNIACIYSVEGKRPLALKYLRIALLNGYAQRESMEKDGDLDNIRGEPEYAELLALLGGGKAAEKDKAPAEKPAPAAGHDNGPPMPDAPPSPAQ